MLCMLTTAEDSPYKLLSRITTKRDRQTDRQTGRQADRDRDRQRQTEKLLKIAYNFIVSV